MKRKEWQKVDREIDGLLCGDLFNMQLKVVITCS